MLVDVKVDQLFQRADRVQAVEVQPLMLERPPPRLNKRIGKSDLRLSKQTLQQSRLDQPVNRARLHRLRPASVAGPSVGPLPALTVRV